ncbi:MAG: diguanylate cyclase [Nitrosomonadales bacterium]|nr:diguanylate cyclase [Nitrosomonadales bacterium]
MKLKSKILLVTTVATATCALLFAVATVYVFGELAERDVSTQGKMGAELMRLTVTHEMHEGNPEHIKPYLLRLDNIPGLLDAHVVPADSVVKQMNMDVSDRRAATPIELQVLKTGKEAYEYLNDRGHVFHYAIPYVATSTDPSNCMACHQAREGEVLGVVSLSMDVSAQHDMAFWSVIGIVLLSFLFGTVIVLAFRRMMQPVVETTQDLNRVIRRAEAGDFSERLQKRGDDEVGEIADKTNQFMQILEDSFGNITKQVEGLGSCNDRSGKGGLLAHTVQVVNNMVSASHFKQAIENDRDLGDVYDRVCRVLTEKFSLKRYSFYEVANSKNHLTLIAARGLPDKAELWCDREVTVDCDACRAKRTALIVSSVDEDRICSAYCGNQVQDNEHLLHICIPIMLSGSVGGVLQVLFTREEAAEVQENMVTLQTYLGEAAPVIEAKRLMQSLKDASMHDPMTNLYNRRFLEGYLETLLATVQRQKTSVGILMCDVDFFKQVNDTYGHETGDKVLVKVADILKKAIRTSDLAIRFGGEEFVALLIGADEASSMAVAERVRKSMEENVFQTGSGPLKKTISVGISLFPTDGEAFWSCVKYADVAMYQAKESGRNKVLRFTRDMWKEEGSY